MIKNGEFLHLGWDDVQLLTEKLAIDIKKSNFIPDVIVAVSRGGFDPARILCDQLDVKKLASIQVEYYEGVKQKKRLPKIIFPLNSDVPKSNVLIVDDVSDTGTSLSMAKEHVVLRRASNVRVATMHVKPWTKFMPDFYAMEVDKWIVYPWEPLEVMREVVAQMRDLRDFEVKTKLIEMGFKERLINLIV